MRLVVLRVVLATLGAATSVSAQTCIASAGGARSVSVAISPLSGGFCFHTVTIYEGASCEPVRAIAHATEGCSSTRRLAVTDDGVLVSVRAPRIARRDWGIVRVFTLAPHAERSLRLDDLPETAALRGAIRVSVDADAVIFRDRRSEVRLALRDLAARLH